MSDSALHINHFLPHEIQNIGAYLCFATHLPFYFSIYLFPDILSVISYLAKSALHNEHYWALLSHRWNLGSTVVCQLFLFFQVLSEVLPLENRPSESLKFIYLKPQFRWPWFSPKSLILIISEVLFRSCIVTMHFFRLGSPG